MEKIADIKKQENPVYISNKLQEALNPCLDYPVTIVEAPIGYGKTVVIREYLKNKEVDVVWVTFSATLEDDLWSQICGSIEKQLPQFAEVARRIYRMGFPDTQSRRYEVVKIIDTIKVVRPVAVVLDDYHLVEQNIMGPFIDLLANIKMEDFTIILLTRDTYPSNAQMLKLKGRMYFIHQDAFILSQQDIKSYYSLSGVKLPDCHATFLFEKTEGWISVLHLQKEIYLTEQVLVIPQSVYDLIAFDVFGVFSKEVKEFLYALSPFQSFGFQQADFVWGKDNTKMLLQELITQNAFVSYNGKEQTYKIHNVLLSYLNQLVEQLPKQKSRALYEKGGAWFCKEKNYPEAMALYLKAQNYQYLMQIIEEDGGKHCTLMQGDMIEQIIEGSSQAVRKEHPYTLFMGACYAYLSNKQNQYRRYCRMLREAAATALTGAWDKKKISGLVTLADSFGHYNDIGEISKSYRTAAQCLDEPVELIDIYKSTWTMGALSVMLMFYRQPGKLQEEVQQMKECLEDYGRITNGCGIGGAFLMEAECLFHAGDFQGANILTYAATASAQQYQQIGSICCAIFLRIRIGVASGNYETVKECLTEITRLATTDLSADKAIVTMQEMMEGYLYAMLGETRLIPAWLKASGGPAERLFVFAYPSYYIIQIRAMLLAKEYAQVIGLVTALLREQIFNRHAIFVIYGTIYQAAALYQMERNVRAKEVLKQALEAAIPDCVYMPFVENYSFLSEMFSSLLQDEVWSEGIKRIIDLAGTWEYNMGHIINISQIKGKAELTPREQEIAALAYQGCTNQQIAHELYIASSTVKRTLVDVFRKLGINSRAQLKEYRVYFEEGGGGR